MPRKPPPRKEDQVSRDYRTFVMSLICALFNLWLVAKPQVLPDAYTAMLMDASKEQFASGFVRKLEHSSEFSDEEVLVGPNVPPTAQSNQQSQPSLSSAVSDTTAKENNEDGESADSEFFAAIRKHEGWRIANIKDFGAIGDNSTDNTHAFHAAFASINETGGEVVVPAGGIFQTAPFNMTSNSILTVEKGATIRGVENQDKFAVIPPLYSYGRDADFSGKNRRLSLVHAHQADNLTIRGEGIIDGAGWYWYPFFHNHSAAYNVGRPHLIEFNNCSNIEITGVTLKDPAFWTLHPVYCQHIYIHHMCIEAPSCRNYGCANTDGIDIDSSQHVLVEYNTLNVGDDHVTVLAGKARNRYIPPSFNITVQHNTLGSGMGLSIGSSTAGGIEDVLYYNNTMTSEIGQMGQGVHIKLRERFGGYVRNIRWIDNTFYVAGKPGGAIVFEGGYQSGNWKKKCTAKDGYMPCPIVSDILIRNLTVHEGLPGRLLCYEQVPCENITLENVRYPNNKQAKISCQNVKSGSQRNNFPENLLDPESCSAFYETTPVESKQSKQQRNKMLQKDEGWTEAESTFYSSI